MAATFTSILNEKIVVFDGAMGTNLQNQDLSPDDFGGERLAGCNEHLVVSRPSAVEKVHTEFLEAGSDVIETNSFGATSVVLAEYGLAERAYELNRMAAALARRVASDFSTAAHPRFVAGSIGPTTKLPSLGHLPFREMAASYETQARGLLDGGADLLCVETCQDLLQAKAALAGVFRAFAAARRRIPVIASVTVESTGTMLLGTEIAAALTALEPYPVDVIGMNCATGPKEMSESVRYLCANSPKPVFVMPNAGIPENVGGRAHYHLAPDEFVYYLSHFVHDLGVQVVGGCCGTTKEHIRKLAAAVGGRSPVRRTVQFTPSVSSLYQSVPLQIDPAPVLVGERTNANGSKLFRELLGRDDWEGMVAVGKDQIREGAHVLDVCTAYVGRDEARDMREFIPRLNTQSTAPLMIDSTEPGVIGEALERIAGRAIVNSVNLEDGEERLARVLPLCREFGAAVIALTIDEQGMAKTVERKVAIAERIHDLAIGKYGMREEDLIFDTLTFTLGSGDPEFRDAGMQTIRALSEIKKRFPAAHTSLGVSNISFGLNPRARHILNSVFLHHAIAHGLDLAIVHASKIMPLYKIAEDERELCRRLIFNERTDAGEDPLQRLLAITSQAKPAAAAPAGAAAAAAPLEERLKTRIIEGNKVGLQADLDEARARYAPLDIINTILLGGMKVVGELFGSGQMQLPFVLQSAEAMKAAVGYLEQYMDKSETHSRGTLVLATVKGDVHDIGKNLVDIILTNNGYTVVNLGIQCPLDRMLAAFEEHRADAIGMSGLLVKSTLIMKENLEVLNERNLLPPIILGGAALTRRFVENDLRAIYRGAVHYANDAFDGLRFMEGVAEAKQAPATVGQPVAAPDDEAPELSGMEAKIALAPVQASPARTIAAADIPVPPFYGSRIVESLPLADLFAYVNEVALFRGQWQVRKGKHSPADYEALLDRSVRPEYERMKRRAIDEKLLEPKLVYGYFPCQSDGDDLIVYRPAGSETPAGEWGALGDRKLEPWVRFTFPRQRGDRRRCIADFFASRASGRMDVVAAHLVTMGSRASEVAHELFTADRYTEYLYFHGLAVETAEALAEYWHRHIRQELGISGRDAADIRKLFSQQYQGSRYSFGYPACPSLEDQVKLFTLLRPERIGVSLTEEFQLVPEQSTSAIIVHHPEARYFNVA